MKNSLFILCICVVVSVVHTSPIMFKDEPDFASIIAQLLDAPDSITIKDAIILGTQQAFIQLDELLGPNPDNADNLTELFQNWIAIIGRLDKNGTYAVTMGELKPYINFFASLNLAIFESIVETIDKLLFNDTQNVVDFLLSENDETTLHEFLISLTEMLVEEVSNSNSKPDNFEEIVNDWYQVLAKFNENGTDSVNLGELKPFLRLAAAALNPQTTASSSNTPAAVTNPTTTKVIDGSFTDSVTIDNIPTTTSEWVSEEVTVSIEPTPAAETTTTKIITEKPLSLTDASTTTGEFASHESTVSIEPTTTPTQTPPPPSPTTTTIATTTTTTTTRSQPAPPKNSKSTANIGVAVGVPISAAVLLVILVIVAIIYNSRKRRLFQDEKNSELDEYTTRF